MPGPSAVPSTGAGPRACGALALLLGAALLLLLAPHVNPWDWSALEAPPAWIARGLWGAGALAGVAAIVLARRRAAGFATLPAAAALALLLFSLFPSDRGVEIVIALLLGSAGVGLIGAGWVLTVPRPRRTPWPLERLPLPLFLLLVFALVLVLSSAASWLLFGHEPPIVDGVAQLLHAKIVRGGSLTVPAPSPPEFFRLSHMVLTDRWYSQYPPGHLLLLTAGVALGVPWLVTPLCGALAVVLLYFVGREAYGPAEGRTAALLGAASSFVWLVSASFMSHASALLFLELFLLGTLRVLRRPSVWAAAAAGGGLGAALAIRPYSAAALAAPVALYAAGVVVRRAARRESGWRPLCLRAALALALLLLFVAGLAAFNAATNGDPWTSGYEAARPDEDVLPGFGAKGWSSAAHTPGRGLVHTLRNLNALNQYLYGLPFPSLALALLWLGAVRPRAVDLLLLASAVSLAVAYLFYWYQDWALGPRFLFEATAPLTLLAARGLVAVAHGGAGLAVPWPPALRRAGAAALAAGFAWALAAHAPMLAAYYSRNHWDGNRAAAAVEPPAGDALVFVPLPYFPSLVTRNDPRLERGPVYAMSLDGDRNRALMARYPGRPAYRLFALDTYRLVRYETGRRFPAVLEYPVPADGDLTVEALSFQLSHIAGGRWRDRHSAELGPGWKNHDFLQVVAEAPGAEVGFALDAPRPLDRILHVAFTHGPEHGVIEVWLDRGRVGPPIDLHAPRLAPRLVDLGPVTLHPGRNALAFRVVGRHPDASGFGLGLDYVRLSDPAQATGRP